jgi:hypothetical protein
MKIDKISKYKIKTLPARKSIKLKKPKDLSPKDFSIKSVLTYDGEWVDIK